ncbi:CHASE2 domain-containing protein [Pigmentiphaga aceris]|uniref:histidine kinase n=1 Tax=Pigmentiphaga aceris TaxID=1940612 RepID=A0A5C0AY41_9BURK|nr:CHASE2 domain-containing protein [Pigmentiphaga aceris]QEI07085.1 CHASE2 domain-containing protein [Pigmentiphaga aceris]
MLASYVQQPERIAFSVAVMLLATGLGLCNGLGRMDTVIRDGYTASAPTPLVADVVVVTIGADCVASIGRWPWPREVHADLLERISAQRPLAVGMDMVLSMPTPDLPTGRHLAVAMGTSPALVPAVFQSVLAGRELNGEASLDPAPAMAWHGPDVESAASMLRHSLLAVGGDNDRWWRQMAVGVVDTTVVPDPMLRGGLTRAALMSVSTGSTMMPGSEPRSLRSARHAQLHPYTTVRAQDVMDGKVAPDVFAGQVVLVGVGASGLQDARALMRTGPMHVGVGIETSAGIADAFLHANPYVRIDAWQNALFTASLALLLLVAMWSHPPARAFKICAAIIFAGVGASYAAWCIAGLWVAPGALLLVGAPVFAVLTRRLANSLLPRAEYSVAGPVMAARLHGEPMKPRQSSPVQPGLKQQNADQQNSKQQHSKQSNPTQLNAQLNGNGHAHHDTTTNGRLLDPDDAEVDYSRERQSVRDFLMAAIESLPDIILVCHASGRVVIGNLAAATYFGASSANLHDRKLDTLLAGLTPVGGGAWGGSGSRFDFAMYQHGVECRDDKGAEFLLKCAPCMTLADGEGWIVSLVDVAALHEAERRRDDAMRFLSHDMRSPLTAILALLTLNREDATELPPAEMLSRIRRLASRSLALAESFVQLARAEPPEHEREPVDLADIVMDAADDCWSQAQSKRITIDVDVPPNAAQSLGDRELVRRAVINLVNNAVKFSPRESRVVCAVYQVEGDWCVAVRDEGRGIAFEDRELLFKKFARLGEREPDAEPGVGLGLAFTKTVVDRHGGRIEVDSVLGVGSEFRIYLKAMV